jgi:hypothetical protein
MHHDEYRSNHGSVALITAPDDSAVLLLADCKAGLGITSTNQDAQITAAIAAVISELDPAEGGWLGRAILEQSWELRLPGFHHHRHGFHSHRYGFDAIALPYPPLIDIVSVKYDDLDGVEQTLVEDTDFRLFGVGTLGKQAIAPLYGQCWPLARHTPESVRIRYTCGYSTDAIPSKLKQAIVLGVRAILNAEERNILILQDQVEGLGAKRFQNNPALAAIVTDAADRLLSTLRAY